MRLQHTHMARSSWSFFIILCEGKPCCYVLIISKTVQKSASCITETETRTPVKAEVVACVFMCTTTGLKILLSRKHITHQT